MSFKIRAKKKQSSKPASLITSLPEDVIIDILARVPRCDYPILSLVSKHFRSRVASPELYARRCLLGCTEHCFYVVLYNSETENYRLYVLHRKANGNRCLVLISSLLDIPWGVSFVTVGSRIYVFGGFDQNYIALSIDCRSHTVQNLPSMPVPMYGRNTIANIVDGRIYLIGNCYSYDTKKVMVVFNTETKMWEPVKIKTEIELGNTWPGCVVVMADKLYMRNPQNSFFYEPTKSKWVVDKKRKKRRIKEEIVNWKTDEMLNSKVWENACVVDNVLYYHDRDKNKLRAYDPKQKCWGVVNGLEKFLRETRHAWWSENVSYGRRLALFWCRPKDIWRRPKVIWCAEIALERRQRGEIWGKVEWCDHVVMSENLSLQKSLAVMV